MRAIVAPTLVLLAGCFGDGPTPTKPAKATILYQVPPSKDDCGIQSYIGPIAFGPNYGFAGLLPYRPMHDCNNDMGSTGGLVAEGVSIYRFPTLGNGEPELVGLAGSSDGTYSPRLQGLFAMDGVMWLAPSTMNGSSVDLGTYPTDLLPPLNIPGSLTGGALFAPAAIVQDVPYLYVAATGLSTGGRYEPNNPNYPCCNVGGGSGGSGNILSRIDLGSPDGPTITALPIAPALDCSHSARCFVQNSTSLFFLAAANGMTPITAWRISQFPKVYDSSSVDVPLGPTIQFNAGMIPVGFHAGEQNVVWSMSRSYDSGSGPSPRCEIDRYRLGNGIGNGTLDPPLFVSDRFDCAGVSVDDESVFFTIVEVTSSNGSTQMRGLGVGRIHLDDPNNVETIRTGLIGPATGPRRVLVDENDVIVVDPFAIARIPKIAFDHQHDFDL